MYHGKRSPDGTCEVWVEDHLNHPANRARIAPSRPLPLRLELRDHSPTGFGWGDDGSGPAQLALALLIDATGDETLAIRHYQAFKRRVVAAWKESWSITAEEVRAFVATPKKHRPPPACHWFEVDKQRLANL